jgi:hypothetical protein
MLGSWGNALKDCVLVMKREILVGMQSRVVRKAILLKFCDVFLKPEYASEARNSGDIGSIYHFLSRKHKPPKPIDGFQPLPLRYTTAHRICNHCKKENLKPSSPGVSTPSGATLRHALNRSFMDVKTNITPDPQGDDMENRCPMSIYGFVCLPYTLENRSVLSYLQTLHAVIYFFYLNAQVRLR